MGVGRFGSFGLQPLILIYPMATLKPVTSSNIHSLGYDPASRVLAVRFIRKKLGEDPKPADEVYHHKEVPPELGEALCAMDEGIGSAYARQVRGKFDHEVVPA